MPGERMPLTRCSAPLMLWRRFRLRMSPLVFSASAPDASLEDTCRHMFAPLLQRVTSLHQGMVNTWYSQANCQQDLHAEVGDTCHLPHGGMLLRLKT